jgi:hypothetical protein
MFRETDVADDHSSLGTTVILPKRLLSQIRASLGMLGVAQAAQVYTATRSGSLGHYSVLNLVRSCLKAEIEFGKVSFPLRVFR